MGVRDWGEVDERSTSNEVARGHRNENVGEISLLASNSEEYSVELDGQIGGPPSVSGSKIAHRVGRIEEIGWIEAGRGSTERS